MQIEEKAIITKKSKCDIYTRISKETPELSNSIGKQISICESFIEKNSDFEIYDSYVDRNFSGYTFDRPSFKKMISDIQKGSVNVVVIKDFSRLGRNNLDVLILVKETFEEHNIRLISINNNYDSRDKNRSNELFFALSNRAIPCLTCNFQALNRYNSRRFRRSKLLVSNRNALYEE